MNIFNFNCPEDDLRRIEHELKESNQLALAQLHALRRIENLLTPRTTGIAIRFSGDTNMAATPGTLAVGATLTGTIVPLEADGTTQTPGAVLSGQQWAVDNSSIASFVQNSDGTATFTGVAAGTATVTATATVTDQDGTTAQFTTTNTIEVSGGTSTGRTTGIQVSFA